MASSTLLERMTAWRGTSAQVKLYFRRMRDGDIPLTSDNMASFEGAMFAIDAEAADLLSEAARLIRETADVVNDALELIRDAEAKDRFPAESEVGEIVDQARQHREQVRHLDPMPVYVPNEDRGYLQDMAAPSPWSPRGKGKLERAHSNIVRFVRRSRHGGAA